METDNAVPLVGLRPIKCELNFLSKPDGSAILSQGETVVLASVYGPGEIKPQKVRNDATVVEAVFTPKSGLSSVSDRQIESLVTNTSLAAIHSSLYPRTGVSITVQEIQDFGGLLACTVNAVCLALINSGIEMKFLIAAVSCCVSGNSDITIDADHKQLQNAYGKMTFIFDNINYNVVGCHTEGVVTHLEYQRGLLKCKQASRYLFTHFRETVKRYMLNNV